MLVARPLAVLAAALALHAVVPVSPATAQGRSPAPARAGEAAKSDEPRITVTGTARVDRAPDFVDVVIGVETEDPSASKAQATTDGTIKAAVAAINKLGLANQELQTGEVELSPRYEDHHPDTDIRHIVAYKATMTVRVRTSELQAPARVIDAALGAGANRVDYVQFGIREAISAREEAIKLAADAAKRKARVLAQGLGMRLGRVLEASTTSQQGGPWYGNRYYSNMAQQVANEGGGGGDTQDAILPGKVEVFAEATVTFAASELEHQ